MSGLDVDVVVAVHDPARTVERAVGSVLDANGARLRVTVVVHNTEPAPILARLAAWDDDPRLRVLRLDDGVRSPAGPFNLGLESAQARFTSVLGSDDELEPGAVDSWLALADRDGSDVVIPRLRFAGARNVPTPPTRPWRRRGLDGVRDRLSYRSAPLGLVSTARFGALRFATGLPVGEDLPYVTALWFSGARIAVDRTGPAYLIHDDAPSRVTFATRPVAEEFGYLDAVLDGRFDRLPGAARSAIVVKFLRIHLFGAVFNRPDPHWWTHDERTALASVARRLLEHGDGIERVLSRRDRALLDAALDPAVPADRLVAAARARRSHAHPAALVPRSPAALLHREAPLRFAAASAVAAAARPRRAR